MNQNNVEHILDFVTSEAKVYFGCPIDKLRGEDQLMQITVRARQQLLIPTYGNSDCGVAREAFKGFVNNKQAYRHLVGWNPSLYYLHEVMLFHIEGKSIHLMYPICSIIKKKIFAVDREWSTMFLERAIKYLIKDHYGYEIRT